MAFYFSRPKNNNNYKYIVHGNPNTLIDNFNVKNESARRDNSKRDYDSFVINNTIVFNPSQKSVIKCNHVRIKGEVWKCEFNKLVPDGYVYLNKIQRAFYNVLYGETIEVAPFLALSNPFDEPLEHINVDVFSIGRKIDVSILNESRFKESIRNVLQGNVLSGRQPFSMNFDGFVCKIIIRPDINADIKYAEISKTTTINIVSYNAHSLSESPISESPITDSPLSESPITDSSINDLHIDNYRTPLQNWNLKKEGVGGLGDVASELFRRAFASRQNPVQAKKLGTRHVKGVLLYGAPGVGKTLIARTIAQLLNKNIPPKVISGPEIFDKYVGESQRKVRDLFIGAENDEQKYGEHSPLHILIFDEFDSIGRKRSSSDDTGSNVASQVVNQLLAKMDGPVPLNNILVVALTNRIDILDSALLRPGRFEIQIEVKLPTESERKEIFEIHTRTMIESGALDQNCVSVEQLAKRTDNFTGAEIEGLVKSAASYALVRTIDIDKDTQQIKTGAGNDLKVTPEDFERAFVDIKPQFGIQQHHLFTDCNDDDDESSRVLESPSALESPRVPNDIAIIDLLDPNIQTVLIYTNDTHKRLHEKIVGKLAVESGVKCLMCIDFFDMIGMNDLQACRYMKEVYQEASKTLKSIIVINHLDTILGIRYNQSILQTVITLLRYYRGVTTIATVSATQYTIETMELDKHFDVIKTIK